MSDGRPGAGSDPLLPALWDHLAQAGPPTDRESTEKPTSLGDMAVALQWITPEQLREALAEQAREGGAEELLGEILLRHRWLNAHQLAYLLAMRPGGRPDPSRLQRIGRYVLKGELGHGGMATVYRAYDTQLKRDVALKFPSAEASDERWMREARATARLSHPNIVSVHDVGEESGLKFAAMELVEGETLEDCWAVWSLRRRMEALEPIARAVDHAHEKGIVHRDIKPGNVMVTRDGQVKVMDFGLARVEGETTVTMTGTVMGTPAYMSPEQVRGDKVGPATDVYSLGVMLYEALVGDVPFGGSQAHEVYAKILSEEPARPARRRAGVPADLEVMCLKAMEKDPGRRYASAGLFAEDLRRWLAGEAILAKPSSRAYRLRKRIRRNPWAWGLGAAVGATALGGLGMIVWMAVGRGREGRAAQEVQFAALSYAAGDLDQARRRAVEALRWIPDHPQALYWLARLELRRYQATRSPPEVRILGGLIEVMPPKPETPEQAQIREQVQRAFQGMPGEPLAEGVLALWDGRYADAARALAEAEQAGKAEGSPTTWEAGLYQVQALMWEGKFEEARQRLDPYLQLDVKLIGPMWGRLLLAQGMEAELRGQDVGVWFQRAEAVGRQLEEAGQVAEGRVLRARVLVEWGKAEVERGRDPEDAFYAQALSLLEGLDVVEASLARGDAHLAMAEFRKTRGRLEPDDPAEFRAAIEEFTKAIEGEPGYGPAYVKRAEAYRARWEYQTLVGRKKDADIDQAKADYARALEANDRYVDAAIGLAHTAELVAFGEAESPQESDAAYEREIEDLDAVIARFPQHAPARTARGRAHHFAAVNLRSHGRDPRPEYQAAAEDFAGALDLNAVLVPALIWRAEALQNLGLYECETGDDPTPAYEAAVADLERALEINPASVEAFLALAAVHDNWAYALEMTGVDPRSEFAAAMEAVGHAIERNPKSATAFSFRGEIRTKLAQFEAGRGGDPLPGYRGALEDFSRAVAIDLDYLEAFVGRGSAHQQLGMHLYVHGDDPMGEYAAAVEDFSRAVEINPARAEAHSLLGFTLQGRAHMRISRGEDGAGDLEEAIAHHTRALEIDPSSAEIHAFRGNAHGALANLRARTGGDPFAQYDAAIADFTKALEIRPGYVEALEQRGAVRQNLAYVRAQQGGDPEPEYRLAIDDFSRALEVDPSSTTALRGRASARQNLALRRVAQPDEAAGEFLRAIEDCERALEVNPSDARLHASLGIIQKNLSDMRGGERALLEEALASFSRAVELNPADAAARQNRGEVLVELGRSGEAVQEFEAAIRLNSSLRTEIEPLLERARREAAAAEF